MIMKLKVCGMREPVNITELMDVSPDYIGLIFYPKSPRYVGNHLKAEEIAAIPPNTKKIGVFVNEEIEKVSATGKKYDLQGVQLHGNETPEYCGLLKKAGFIIIKAFPIDETIDFESLKVYDPVTDYFLFDTKTPQYGGSGQVFNWNILKKYDNHKPFFLSGGIDLGHVDDIAGLSSLNIHAIDINSRFEFEPGLKDVVKIREFLRELRVVG
jgi:phosphoribosylanthranilate isomerase